MKTEESQSNSADHHIYPGLGLLLRTNGLARPTFLLAFLCPSLNNFWTEQTCFMFSLSSSSYREGIKGEKIIGRMGEKRDS